MSISTTPLVSIVVTSFNRPNFLKECLISIQNQTISDFEVIVVDDYSSFDWSSFITAFSNDERFSFYQNKTNGVVAVNRNFALNRSQGTYVAFCDDDDVWKPEKLEKQLDAFRRNPELKGVATNIETFPNGSSNHYRLFKNFRPSYRFLLHAPFSLSRQIKIANSSVVVLRDTLMELEGLDDNPLLTAAEDYDMWLRILEKYDRSFLVLKDSLVKYRGHEENSSSFSSNTEDRTFIKLVPIYEKHKNGRLLLNKIPDAQEKHNLKKEYFKGELSVLNFLQAPHFGIFEKLLIVIKKAL